MSRDQEGEQTPVRYGYDAAFQPDIDSRYVCPVCLMAIRDAVQTKCGHRFCKFCLTNTHGTLRFSRCPVDKTWYDTLKDVFVDTAFNREVLSQNVKCGNHMIGCTWQGELRHLQEHEESCPEIEVDCANNCGEKHKRRQVVEHQASCPRRLVSCLHCGEEIIAVDLLKHQLLVCKRFPVNCTMCGHTGLLRDQVSSHLDPNTGDCPMVSITCYFSAIGCLIQEKRKDMARHYDEAVNQHMSLLCRQVALCEERLDRHERHLSDIMGNIEQLLDVSVRHGRTLGRYSTEIAEQTRRLDEIEATSYTGQLLWRVSVPDRRTFQALSPAFYTARPGYKFRVVLESAGYEHNGLTYASMFVQLEKGMYDDQLTFPYTSSCQVSVIGQQRSCNQVHSASIPCANMPRVHGDQPHRKVCLKFIKSDDLFSSKFLFHDTLLLQVFIRELNS